MSSYLFPLSPIHFSSIFYPDKKADHSTEKNTYSYGFSDISGHTKGFPEKSEKYGAIFIRKPQNTFSQRFSKIKKSFTVFVLSLCQRFLKIKKLTSDGEQKGNRVKNYSGNMHDSRNSLIFSLIFSYP